ncbi:MAG TPA: 2-phosphosulfolactate phosphatase [Thermosynergistes sp.]|nr:2-phosphosulfolactate phosphatase [Thermosynergistes sp.]
MEAQLDVILSPTEAFPSCDIWLVVDVLRATTTMTIFFECGGKKILPVESVEEGLALKRSLGSGWLLMGERKGLPPQGFDLGNSPLEVANACVSRYEGAIMTTTNGTRALLAAASTGAPVLIASARNALAAVDAALSLGSFIGIICAGRLGRASLDDSACAGALVDIALEKEPKALLSDGARIVHSVWCNYGRNMEEALKDASHARFLLELGFGDDIRLACQLGASASVPKLAFVNERWTVLT